MSDIARSIVGIVTQLNNLMGRTTVVDPITTLNTKYNIYKDELPPENVVSKLSYYTIGIGGTILHTGIDNISINTGVRRKARYASLFRDIPFVMRLPDDDLTPLERRRFRLRKMMRVDGVEYIVYWLRLIPDTTGDPIVSRVRTENGKEYRQPYEPTLSDLNPVAETQTYEEVANDYITVDLRIKFVMDDWDRDEFLNVITVLYGDIHYGVLSEVGLCTGVDKIVSDLITDGESYTEVINAQLMSSVNMNVALYLGDTNIDSYFDLGAIEP